MLIRTAERRPNIIGIVKNTAIHFKLFTNAGQIASSLVKISIKLFSPINLGVPIPFQSVNDRPNVAKDGIATIKKCSTNAGSTNKYGTSFLFLNAMFPPYVPATNMAPARLQQLCRSRVQLTLNSGRFPVQYLHPK